MTGLGYAGLILLGVIAVGAVVYGRLRQGARADATGEDGRWINGSGTINERPAVFRADLSLFDLPNREDYGYELIVSVKLQDPDELGFPQQDEANGLYEYEDAVMPAVQAGGWGRLAVVLTTDGFRDFIFYVKDHHSAPERLDPLKPHFPNLQVEMLGKPDPQWTQLERFSGE